MANGYLGHVPKFSTNKPEVIPAGTLNHTLEFAPGTPSALFVVVGGVPQEPNVAYTVSGKTLTFSEETPYDGWLVYRNKEGFSVGTAALKDTLTDEEFLAGGNDNSLPNSRQVMKVVNSKTSLPSMTGSVTLNGTTDNTVDLTDIVTELGLEIGDVIRIDTEDYNKLHTVESITNDDSIIVNYEHAGNRSNGSLKLPNFIGQVEVTRVAKWFNAPIGLGQAWVTFYNHRSLNVTYTNNTGRTIQVSRRHYNITSNFYVIVDGKTLLGVSTSASTIDGNAYLAIPNGSTYSITTTETSTPEWHELR